MVLNPPDSTPLYATATVYTGKVDEEVLAVEQARIDRERAEAHKWADAAAQDGADVMEALDEALALLADPQVAYAQATPHTQRLLNQALFTALLVRDEEISGSEQTPWVAAMRRLAQTASQPARGRQNGQEPRQRGRNGRDPQEGGRVLNDNELVHLVGHISNPSSSLRAIFEALPDGPIVPKAGSLGRVAPKPKMLKLGNGVVLAAVVKALAVADRPMRLSEVRTAVDALLGQSVSKDSIGWCLSTGTRGDEPRFERVARGCYRLLPPT